MDGAVTGFDWPALLALARVEGIADAIASHLFSQIELNMLIAESERG